MYCRGWYSSNILYFLLYIVFPILYQKILYCRGGYCIVRYILYCIVLYCRVEGIRLILCPNSVSMLQLTSGRSFVSVATPPGVAPALMCTQTFNNSQIQIHKYIYNLLRLTFGQPFNLLLDRFHLCNL